jgi:hypothetical protein
MNVPRKEAARPKTARMLSTSPVTVANRGVTDEPSPPVFSQPNPQQREKKGGEWGRKVVKTRLFWDEQNVLQ